MPSDTADFKHTPVQQDMLDFVNERFEVMDTFRRSTYDEPRRKAYEDYRNISKPAKRTEEDEALCDIHIPVGTYYGDSAFAEIFVELMGKRPLIPVDAGGQSEQDVIEAKITEGVLDYQLGGGPDMWNFYNLVLMIKEILICDCGVAKVDWETNPYYDGPRIHWWPLSEFWMDERAKHVCMARDMIFQTRLSKRELERRVKNESGGHISHNWQEFLKLEPEMDEADQERKTAVGSGSHHKSGTYKIWEYHGDDGMIYEFGVEGTRAVCMLREWLNPNRWVPMGRSVIQVSTSPDLIGWGGIPVHQKMGDLTEWLDTLVRQSVDAFTLQNIPRYKVRSVGDIDEYALVRPKPGQLIHMMNLDDVQPLDEGRDRTNQQQSWMGLIMSQMEEASGRYRGQRGAPKSGGSDTATEFLSLKGMANLRVTAQEIFMQVFGFRALGYIMTGLNWQYQDIEVPIKIIDAQVGDVALMAKLKKENPDEAKMHFNIMPAPHLGTENKTIRTQQYMMALKILSSNPQVAPYVPWDKFLIELFTIMELPAPQRFVKSQQEAMEIMQAQAAIQGGATGGGGMKLGTGPGGGVMSPAGAGSAETGMMQREAMSAVPQVGAEGGI